MIRLLDHQDEIPSSLCGQDVAGIKIEAALLAYGTKRPFAMFWRQMDARGSTTALLCGLDGFLTLTAAESAGFAELKEFLSAVSSGPVFCAADLGERLGLTPAAVFPVLLLDRLREPALVPDRTDWNPKLDELYALFRRCSGAGIVLPEREAWIADASHRIRHGVARAVSLIRDGRPVSAAMTSAETKAAALISGVAVTPEYRGKGLGLGTAFLLCDRLAAEEKKVYLCAAEEGLRGFYGRIGFYQAGYAGIFQ